MYGRPGTMRSTAAVSYAITYGPFLLEGFTTAAVSRRIFCDGCRLTAAAAAASPLFCFFPRESCFTLKRVVKFHSDTVLSVQQKCNTTTTAEVQYSDDSSIIL